MALEVLRSKRRSPGRHGGGLEVEGARVKVTEVTSGGTQSPPALTFFKGNTDYGGFEHAGWRGGFRRKYTLPGQ